VGEYLETAKGRVEIVGVVKDVPYAGLRLPKELVLYRPYFQAPSGLGGLTFALRTDLPAGAAADLVRAALREIAPSVPLSSIVSLDAHVDSGIASERLLAGISLFFGMMALLLVGVGVYGTLAYTIAQRTRELGIRVALGASPGAIVTMILRGALTPVCLGLALGVPLASLASQVVRAQLFGVDPSDPLASAIVMAVLLGIAAVAAVVPARGAAGADPIEALREP
jgi:ABC-type antimicrobial peptide transport system permease subunit